MEQIRAHMWNYGFCLALNNEVTSTRARGEAIVLFDSRILETHSK